MPRPREVLITDNGSFPLSGGHHGEVTKTLVHVTDPGTGTASFRKRLSGLTDAQDIMRFVAFRNEITHAEEVAGAFIAAGLYSIETEGCDLELYLTMFDVEFRCFVRSVAG
jgi:hypothetical protein